MTRKEKLAALVGGENYKPLLLRELAAALKVPEKSLSRFMKELDALIEEGLVLEGKKGRIYSAASMGLVRGLLRVNPKGFGFVTPLDTEGDDLYVAGENLDTAVDGDTVLVRKLARKDRDRDCWAVSRVVKRGTQTLVGTLKLYAGAGLVTPDSEKLPREVYVSETKGALDGQKVLVKITEYACGAIYGTVEEILGYPDDFGVDVLSIIKNYDFSTEFPKKVTDEALSKPEDLSPSEIEGRLDLRDRLIITIDGDDSKDLDDAVSLEKTHSGWRLGVHIADVSHYVTPRSPLDREALSRGTSVYLADRVIPMLPPRLSNGLCSLNEGLDRLTLSAIMELDSEGRVTKSRFYKSVIKSSHRMTYNNVLKLLEGRDPALAEKYSDILPMLREMDSLSQKLKTRSIERGYIELDIPEAKAILDENGRAVGIELRKTNRATELIEQFMVCANVEAAKYLWKNKCPAIYRVHDLPDPDRLAALRRFAATMGYDPRLSLQALVKKAAPKPEGRVISAMTLRSMAKALYSPKNTGHYGLGAEYYCHFTSPIRRYPDLICHRALKAAIDGDGAALRAIARMNSDAAVQSSERETAAEHCERDVLDMKKAQYMEQFVGQSFNGIISSVTGFGFFVALPDTVEGLVSIISLRDDYYIYDESSLSLRGERTGTEYKIGDEVEVTLVSANHQNRKIDFELKNQRQKKQKEVKGSGGKQRRKNLSAKQKRVSRVFHRRKNRGGH